MHAGLAPEKVHLLEEGGFKVDGGDVGQCAAARNGGEPLLHVAAHRESSSTGEWGWEIFQAFQKHAKGDVGYHSLKVNLGLPTPLNQQYHSCGGALSQVLQGRAKYYQT